MGLFQKVAYAGVGALGFGYFSSSTGIKNTLYSKLGEIWGGGVQSPSKPIVPSNAGATAPKTGFAITINSEGISVVSGPLQDSPPAAVEKSERRDVSLHNAFPALGILAFALSVLAPQYGVPNWIVGAFAGTGLWAWGNVGMSKAAEYVSHAFSGSPKEEKK